MTRAASQPRTGFALFSVLWFLVLLSAFGLWVMAVSRSHIAQAHNVVAAAHAEMLADGGVAQAVFHLTDPAGATLWLPDGKPHLLKSQQGSLAITITDEAGKINPNLASAALLSALFEICSIDAGKARALGAAISDWIDADDDPQLFGAESNDYRVVGKGYIPRNAEIETLDELLLVMGADRATIDRVRPFLSIFALDAVPGSAYAAEPVRRAVLLAQQRDNKPADVQPAVTTDPSTDLPARTIVGIRVDARSADGATFIREAVIATPDESLKGYAVLDWRRGELSPNTDCKIAP